MPSSTSATGPRPQRCVPPTADGATVADVSVTGRLPEALCGHLLGVEPEPTRGRLHAVALGGGRVRSYRHRAVVATDVVAFDGRVLAFADRALAHELPPDLATVRPVDLAGGARGVGARPVVDPRSGDLHLLAVDVEATHAHVVVARGGLRRRSRALPDAPGALHGLLLTPERLVLVADGFVGVAARAGEARVRWAPTGAGVVRPVAADDDGDAVALVVLTPALERWHVGGGAASVGREVLDAAPQASACAERPAAGSRHRVVWSAGAGRGGPLRRHDLSTGASEPHDLGHGVRPGPLVVVDGAGRRGPPDGPWLVGLVHDEARDGTDLVVVEGGGPARSPVATVHLPRCLAGGGAPLAWIGAAAP